MTRPIFPRQSLSACTHHSLDDDRLYRFVRDTRLPRGTFDHGWHLTPNGATWLASAILAVALVAAAFL